MVERIARSEQFDRLRRSRRSSRAGCLRVSMVAPGSAGPLASDPPAVGFAIPRSTGNAVLRNRIRRRLRQILAAIELSDELPAGWYLVSVRPSEVEPDYWELEHALRRVLRTLREPRDPGDLVEDPSAGTARARECGLDDEA